MKLFTDKMAKSIFVFDTPKTNVNAKVTAFRPKTDVKLLIKKQSLGIR